MPTGNGPVGPGSVSRAGVPVAGVAHAVSAKPIGTAAATVSVAVIAWRRVIRAPPLSPAAGPGMCPPVV
ncbi:hypothetical protein GCM10010532_070880 [Dactylosporangium siamense]|uniref:Uncharacterized protein n=1 Tax=Dactylosporangium siamense TaxID=685454 RepID=A0A919PRP2_9ACTN|nr:hypothetical protein Dsi01nite_052090 [Dactylosporangium siamense]